MISILVLGLFASVVQSQTAQDGKEPRHLDLVREAIMHECGVKGSISSTTVQVITKRVDQGITDYGYNSEISLRVALNDSRTQILKFNVISDFADMYDHNTKNWGVYHVSKVTSNEASCKSNP